MFKITSVTVFQTAEGNRMSYTYSEIDDNTLEIKNSNIRRSVLLPDENKELTAAINQLKNHAESSLVNVLEISK